MAKLYFFFAFNYLFFMGSRGFAKTDFALVFAKVLIKIEQWFN